MRIVHKRIRRDIIAVSAFLLGLFIVRICRYFLFVHSLTIVRYLWYLYYIPYIGLPVLTLDAAYCVGKSERMKTPAGLPAGVLFCAVTVFIAVRGCLQRLRKAADLNRSRSRR